MANKRVLFHKMRDFSREFFARETGIDVKEQA
jgi:hypothetical protein